VIRVEVAPPVATIWLDRPDKRNAMTHSMWDGLERACLQLAADRSVGVVVVRGAGGNFCAGADIGELLLDRDPSERSFNAVNMAAEHALAVLPKPTVAFIEGDCIGGGCAIAIDCDIRIANAGARFGITPAKLGVVYPVPSLERVARLLGTSSTKYLLFTGQLIGSEHALRLGLVDEVHPDEHAVAALAALVGALASRSLLTQSATKEMVAAVASHGSVPAELANRWAREAAVADDLAEGVAAFAARRPPQFTWDGPAER
jgi:enoyl-CoA hydratase/carnithine racemase